MEICSTRNAFQEQGYQPVLHEKYTHTNTETHSHTDMQTHTHTHELSRSITQTQCQDSGCKDALVLELSRDSGFRGIELWCALSLDIARQGLINQNAVRFKKKYGKSAHQNPAEPGSSNLQTQNQSPQNRGSLESPSQNVKTCVNLIHPISCIPQENTNLS